MNKLILLSFDVEEFDITSEYGEKLDESRQFEVCRQGLTAILDLLQKLEIKATFFTTANFAINNREIVEKIAANHEIGSHGFYHANFKIEDLKTSRQTLQQLTAQEVLAFRMPRLKETSDRDLVAAGYQCNSSLNPTYLPGRYNNFFKPRTAYYSNNLLNLPVSVTPIIRFPLFWLSFKNFPLWFMQLNSQLTITKDKYLNIYFHPWEFADLKSFQLPGYIKNCSGREMISKLEQYLLWLKRQGEFIYFSEFQQKCDLTQQR